jgi:predicted Ser/Thr protein kinase
MMGSANELHLDAFREHPEFASFRGRLDLVRVPYLRNYKEEQAIYDAHVAPQVRRHVAPHATEMAAVFAVLTRMRKPNADRYGRGLTGPLQSLSAVEKADVYAGERPPERFDADTQKLLRASVRELYEESDSYPIYEGRVGASPREMRAVLLDAAQSTSYRCLSPLAVLDELEILCQRKNEFEWLQQDVIPGGYHDVKIFGEALLSRLLSSWEVELYASSGLVDDVQYAELFERYVQHVSVWVKRERIRNRVTGEYEEPDEKMMREVERLLDVKAESSDWRKGLISGIAAWAIDHPGQRVEGAMVFPQHMRRMREAIFNDRRPAVALLARDVVVLVRDEGTGLDKERRRDAESVIERMIAKFGYCRSCAGDAASMLVRKRFSDLVV